MAGSCSWHELRDSGNQSPKRYRGAADGRGAARRAYLMEELSSSISSRSLLTSSCSCCLSCWSFPMCSTVFCSVTALLIWIGKKKGGGERRARARASYGRLALAHVRLGLQRGHQAAERLEADVDVGPPLLLSRDVCGPAALSAEMSQKQTDNNPPQIQSAQPFARGSEPTCFCSFFTRGVQLLISGPGLGA